MVTYQEYFEEAFNIKKAITDIPVIKRFIHKLTIKRRAEARKGASENIKKLKAVLKKYNYDIGKGESNYHQYRFSDDPSKKALRLAPHRDDPAYLKKNLGKDNIPYVKVLFTLAHEVGHALQWDHDTDEMERFDDFFDEVWAEKRKATMTGMTDEIKSAIETIQHIHKMWYEINAWVKGLEYIPKELTEKYKKYAIYYLFTYMKDENPLKYYIDNPTLRQELAQILPLGAESAFK